MFSLINSNERDIRARYFDLLCFYLNNTEMHYWFTPSLRAIISENIDTILDILIGRDVAMNTLESGECMYQLEPGDFVAAHHGALYVMISAGYLLENPKFKAEMNKARLPDAKTVVYEKWNTTMKPLEMVVCDYIEETQRHKHLDDMNWETMDDKQNLQLTADELKKLMPEVIVKSIIKEGLTSRVIMHAVYCEKVYYADQTPFADTNKNSIIAINRLLPYRDVMKRVIAEIREK